MLLLDGKRLVKTVRFSKKRYVGDPVNTLKILNEKEVDEIFLIDISKKTGAVQDSYLKEIASELFSPAAFGGNLQSPEDALQKLKLGFEKIVIPFRKIWKNSFLQKISATAGSQSAVVSLDVRKLCGPYYLINKTPQIFHQKQIRLLLKEIQEQGAGEILLHFVHRDGTFLGYDKDILACLPHDLSVPLILLGGAKNEEEIQEVLKLPNVDAAAAGSLFSFFGVHRAVLPNYLQK